jgi:hypothetical protein
MVLGLMLGGAGLAAEKPQLRYIPRADEERPILTSVTIGPQEGRLALKVTFDKPPSDEECKQRCANSSLYLDLDDNPASGLQLGKAAETGADIVLTIQGIREYHEVSGESRLRVKVRQFTDTAKHVEEGATFADLDVHRDVDHLIVKGDTVYILIDIVQVDVPAGKKMRLIFHPPGAKAVQATGPGMLSTDVKTPIFPK